MLTALVIISIVTLVASLIALPIVVVRLPHDYFVREGKPPSEEVVGSRHPVMILLKNVFGVLLVAGGFAMLVLPGQGILSIVAGLALIDFPRKRRLQRFILLKSGAHRILDRIRHRAGKDPFHLHEPEPGASHPDRPPLDDPEPQDPHSPPHREPPAG